MAIGDQFSGLDMGNLIGGPLRAAADASMQLADSTASFINKVGFDEKGNTRTASFQFEKKSYNEDGTTNQDEMKIDVPMLAIVPIPNLQVDEVNILFDMEVKESEKSEKATDLSAAASGSINLGIAKVNISGSVSSHSSNTRSTDNSAKYHVDVRATNHGTPEGLARVLDMMAASVSPALIDSKIKDANGQELPEERKDRSERIKSLNQEILLLETQQSAAEKALNEQLQQFKRIGSQQQNQYQLKLQELINKNETEEAEQLQANLDQLNTYWNTFQTQIPNAVKSLASKPAQTEPADAAELSCLFTLKSVSDTGSLDSYAKEESNYYSLLAEAQNQSVEAQKHADEISRQCSQKKIDYNKLISGIELKKEDQNNPPSET